MATLEDIRYGRLDGFRVNYAVGIVEMCIGAAIGVIAGNLVDGAVARIIDKDTTYYKVTNLANDPIDKTKTLPFDIQKPALHQPGTYSSSEWYNSNLRKQLDVLIKALEDIDNEDETKPKEFLVNLEAIIKSANDELLEITTASIPISGLTRSSQIPLEDKDFILKLQSLVDLIQSSTALSTNPQYTPATIMQTESAKREAVKSKIKEIITYNTVLKSTNSVEGSANPTPDNLIQKINITPTIPYANPGILSFGIYLVCVGTGALIGAKRQLKK